MFRRCSDTVIRTLMFGIQEVKPEQIRPYPVLQRALAEIKVRWREKCKYSWICSQLKSIRQDLTVRRVFCYMEPLASGIIVFTGPTNQK
jgi:hypothetical protein